MDRVVGDSVGNFVARFEGERVSLSRAAGLGIRMIQTIRKLHELGVVHGDAHSGNFLFEQVQSVEGELVGEMKMIDFERAKFFNVQDACDSSPEFLSALPLRNLQPTVWNSIWEGCGCPRSFRDDIHRIFVSIALLIHGTEYFDFLLKLTRGHPDTLAVTRGFWAIWRHFRNNFHIFHLTGFPKYMSSVMKYKELHMTGRTEFALDKESKDGFRKLELYLKAMTITEVPDYDFIIGSLEAIRERTRAFRRHPL